MLRQLAPEALDRSVKPRVHDYAVAGGVILVHTFFVVRDDDVGLDAADHVADLEAHIIVVGQQAVRMIEHDGFTSEHGREALGLGDFVFSVFEDVRPGGCAFLARGERERHRPAAGHGAGCEQRPCGQLHVADVRADREYRFTVYIFHLKAPLS